MNRSKWKGPFINAKLFKDLNNIKSKNTIKTTSRNSEITPIFIGLTFNLYNGKSFSKIEITKDMVGLKLGEFSPTRRKFSFKKNKIKKNDGTKNKF
jgi:small subunit ribosomal protein S19